MLSIGTVLVQLVQLQFYSHIYNSKCLNLQVKGQSGNAPKTALSNGLDQSIKAEEGAEGAMLTNTVDEYVCEPNATTTHSFDFSCSHKYLSVDTGRASSLLARSVLCFFHRSLKLCQLSQMNWCASFAHGWWWARWSYPAVDTVSVTTVSSSSVLNTEQCQQPQFLSLPFQASGPLCWSQRSTCVSPASSLFSQRASFPTLPFGWLWQTLKATLGTPNARGERLKDQETKDSPGHPGALPLMPPIDQVPVQPSGNRHITEHTNRKCWDEGLNDQRKIRCQQVLSPESSQKRTFSPFSSLCWGGGNQKCFSWNQNQSYLVLL